MTITPENAVAALTSLAALVAAIKAKNYRAATNVLVDSIEEATKRQVPIKVVVHQKSRGTTAGKVIARTVRKRTPPPATA